MGVALSGVVITRQHTIDIEPMDVTELSLQQNMPGANIAKLSKNPEGQITSSYT